MRNTFVKGMWAVMLTILLLGSMNNIENELDETDSVSEAGRQEGGVVAECEGLTFEDMFNYTHADFEFEIADDWETAYVRAVAWVNGTLADDVRFDFDELFEPLGTDNGWLSTDEYRTVRAIAAQCVEQTNPRVGFRSGPPHRGGGGVNWFNASWLNTDDNPMVLEEWNLMPGNHVDERTCPTQNPQNDCVEIPVAPITQGRDCDTTITHPDECRLIIWLNATLEFDTQGMMSGGSDEFTIAMNTSNMTNTDMHITFPEQSGLRINLFEECDGRRIDQANNSNQGATPAPGDCDEGLNGFGNDDSISVSSRLVSINGQTRLKVDAQVEYDMSIWPTGQDMFFDMTTTPPETDDPPSWTSTAPAEGNIMPIADDGRVLFVSSNQMAAWAEDDQGTPLISCTSNDANLWSMSSDAEGLSAIAPGGTDSTTVTCQATDSSGQTSEMRNFTLQVPMRPIAAVVGGNAEVTMTPTTGMPEMQVVVTLTQPDAQVSSNSMALSGTSTISIPLESMSPGPLMVEIVASGTGMATFSHIYDLDMDKESATPTLSLSTYEWYDGKYEMQGNFNDPDGDSVTITATNDGFDWGDVVKSGNQWMVSGPGIDSIDSMNSIVITACDSWNKCSTITHEAGQTPGVTSPPPVDTSEPKDDDDGGGLPGFGLFAALAAFALAGTRMRRRE
ncbi:MAG: hypothetical protein QF440_06095 [Candidatus Thalassarchaeaceae archaeon]|nr:hypothetical protein [Candidatus Thalassarchaeaceae archaeon]